MRSGNDGSARSHIEVLYEDAHMLAIHKPAGIMVHEDGRGEEPTVVDWLLARAPMARGVGEPGRTPEGAPLERSGVVHRLDRETSGVLVLAKTQDAFTYLKSQFHDHTVEKEYRAFVYGVMKEKWGTINRPIGRSSKDFRRRSAERGARGTLRSAVTHWELIDQSASYAYLTLHPKTGRTHQIRVHLKAIGRPVVGDSLYASKTLLESDNLGFTRLALHAYRLVITTLDGVRKELCAPLPEDFKRAAYTIATK